MNREKQYYAGIDGGGTGTRIAVADERQNIVYRGEGGSINVCGIEPDVAKANLLQVLAEALEAVRSDRFETLVIGSASAFDSEDQNCFAEWETDIPAKRILWHSDLEIALSATDGGNKAVIASGTGSMLMSDCQGQRYAVGGYGHLVGDEGSAYDIAARGIRAAIQYWEGWGEETALYGALLSFYGIASPRGIVEKVYLESRDKRQIANFSRVVGQAAAAGDKVARIILEEAAEALFEQFCALDKKCGGRIERVSLVGSVLLPGSIAETALRAKLERYRSELEVSGVQRQAVVGALRCCFGTGPYHNDLV